MIAYHNADSLHKSIVVDSVRKYLLRTIINEIFPPWYGTPWDFYGTSRIPGSGTIACGYFVTGILTDAGFDIPRVKWAQLASEEIIKRISRDLKRFSDRPVEEVIAYIKSRPNGLYVVGLDHHVGFIFKYNTLVRFVHSNYYHQYIGVMSEELDSENPLKDSHYRIVGRIMEDKMIISWIENSRIE